MRILYFHQHFSTPLGATGTRSYEMARRLVERGHGVTMVCGSYSAADTGLEGEFRRGRREGVVDGIHVIELDLPYANRDSFLRRTWVFARFAANSIGIALRQRADLIFATSTPLTAAIPGIVAHWVRRTPFIFEVRDLWPELPRAMGVITNPVALELMEALEWASYRSSSRCIGLAPGVVDGIVEHKYERERVAMVPNGCDLGLFEPDRRAVKRDPWFKAVFAGTHGIANGLDAVLDAAAELRRRGRGDISIVMVGEGRLKPALRERAEREHLPVEFLDPLPKERLSSLLRDAGAGLMVLGDVPAFYRGTSPNKFFDYISAGLPIVNNYPGWIADIVTEQECGMVVPPGDAVAFADALERLADDRALARRLGANARRVAEAEFDRERLAERFVEVLEGTVGAESGSAGRRAEVGAPAAARGSRR